MSVRRLLLMLWPVTLFAAVLVALQAIRGHIDWGLPLRTVAVAAAAILAAQILPWAALMRRVRPGSPFFPAVLFLWILRHFVILFGEETRRVMIARRLAVPREYRKGWFRSLRWAVTGIFKRALVRAERFYAAQAVRGLER